MYFIVKNCQKTFQIACDFTTGNQREQEGKCESSSPPSLQPYTVLFLEKKHLPGISQGTENGIRFTVPGLRNYIPARPFQYCTGQGATLEEAEQDAARKALQSIRASDSEVARVFV